MTFLEQSGHYSKHGKKKEDSWDKEFQSTDSKKQLECLRFDLKYSKNIDEMIEEQRLKKIKKFNDKYDAIKRFETKLFNL